MEMVTIDSQTFLNSFMKTKDQNQGFWFQNIKIPFNAKCLETFVKLIKPLKNYCYTVLTLVHFASTQTLHITKYHTHIYDAMLLQCYIRCLKFQMKSNSMCTYVSLVFSCQVTIVIDYCYIWGTLAYVLRLSLALDSGSHAPRLGCPNLVLPRRSPTALTYCQP